MAQKSSSTSDTATNGPAGSHHESNKTSRTNFVGREDRHREKLTKDLRESYGVGKREFKADELEQFEAIDSVLSGQNRTLLPIEINLAKSRLEDAKLQTRRRIITDKAVNAYDKDLADAEKRLGKLRSEKEHEESAVMLRAVLQRLFDTRENRTPPTIQRFYIADNSCPQIGQAYEGHNYAFKQKCLYCEILFHFAKLDGESELRDFKNVAEFDYGKYRPGKRRCRAEGIAFVLALEDADILELKLKVKSTIEGGRG